MNKIKLIFKSLITLNGLTLIGILLLAAFYRLYKIADYMTFLGDEGRDVLKVYEILHGQLTLLGPTSSVGGFFLGSIYYYFMAPFLLLFNYDPVGPAVMVALFGVATVALLYFVVSRFFDKKVAIFASLLYAISPLIVSYSRSSWNPNPLPFFSLLTLILILEALRRNNLKLFLASGILLGVSMQLHYLALFLGVVVFVYVLFTMLFKSFNRETVINLFKRYLTIFVGFLIGWSPFIIFELRHNFLNFRNIFEFVLHSGNTGTNEGFFKVIADVFFRLFGRSVFAFPLPEHFSRFNPLVINLWTIFIIVMAVLSVTLLVYKFYKSLKEKNIQFYVYSLLTFWFFVSILLFGFYKKPIYDYYFAFLFPLPFILVSLLLKFIWENKKYLKKFSAVVAVTIFIVIFLMNIQGIPFRYPPNRQLNQMKSIADFIMTKTNAKPFNFALITGGNSDHAYRYFFTVWNHPPTTIEYEGVDPDRKSVTDQLFVICESVPCEPVGHSLWEIAGFGRAEIESSWDVSVSKVYKLVHYEEK